MKIKSVELLNAIIIPGTKVGGDMTLNATKQFGIELELVDNLLMIKIGGKVAAVPLSSVRVIVYE